MRPIAPADNQENLVNSLREKILSAVDVRKIYPRRALVKGWQGRVEVLITLNSRGSVKSVSVDKSSGRRILDKAAIRMVQNVSSTLTIPTELGFQEIRVPIEFKLDRR